jgi:hypothetical protein
MIQASTTLFKDGEQLAIVPGILAVLLFVVTLGTSPDESLRDSAAGGRAALGRLLRWVFLVIAVAGLIMMLVATVG